MKYLKCDRKGCDHTQEVTDITEELVGTPCPKCGDNLLTEADYRVWRRLWRIIRVFQWLRLLKPADPTKPLPKGSVEMSFHHHKGKTTIEETRR